ncbi:MAG TPA: Gfo/Idh/MocA family oxidoreductase [Anaeromyxobacter sp.]|nr:Gfo/Idh/MocA family oxidoreductase [Anaeromyxobacter sp.]
MIEGSAQGSGRSPRCGMVGGGPGAFIGDVHRKAIALDGSAALVAGCFTRSHENTRSTGRALGLPDDRLYRSLDEMAEAESRRKDGIDFAVVVTPNGAHHAAATAFLSRGIPVVCDKPLVFEEKEAQELKALATAKDLLFCVTYTYTGYPAMKHAREMIARGDVGPARFVHAEYPQEWLATLVEHEADLDFPDVEDGLSGVRFIGRRVESSQQGAVWVDF